MARFVKGQSGNPAGRPKARRPNVSAFDIIFDKSLTVTQNGIERELTVDEALQLQTYQAALKGSKMAVRAVLKMIERREAALAVQTSRPEPQPSKAPVATFDTDSANEAMRLLGIVAIYRDGSGGYHDNKLKLQAWATQAALSRPGRRQLESSSIRDIKLQTFTPEKLKWPRSRGS